MRYSYNGTQLSRSKDIVRSRARARTKPVEEPGAESSEGTTEQLRLFAEGKLDAVTLAQRYVLRRVLGRGGMATVYEAYDRVLARLIALKVLHDNYAGEPRLLARFLSEARTTAQLHHPNIVHALDFGTTRSGVVYLTMELLRGEDLRRKLGRESQLSWAETKQIMLDICAGLEVAHEGGIVHRDLKPSNCYLVSGGGQRERVRILDFGIAIRPERQDGRVTQGGRVLGTPDYMAPEQIRGEVVDHRADIYSLGIVLGEMLTGKLAFDCKTREATLAAHIYEPVPSLTELADDPSTIPPGVEMIYARALAKDPVDRFADIRSFAAALRAVDRPIEVPRPRPVAHRGRSTRRWTVAAVALILASLAGIGAGLGVRAEASPGPAVAVEVEPESKVEGERPVALEPAPLASSSAREVRIEGRLVGPAGPVLEAEFTTKPSRATKAEVRAEREREPEPERSVAERSVDVAMPAEESGMSPTEVPSPTEGEPATVPLLLDHPDAKPPTLMAVEPVEPEVEEPDLLASS